MNWLRITYIIKIYLLATLRRIRYDFAREIVVGVSAVVLGALFLYIFNDFINVKVLSLSAGTQHAFAQAATGILLILATVFLRKRLGAERMGHGVFCRYLIELGETPVVVKAFLTLRAIMLPLLVYAVCWLVIQRYFAPWSIGIIILIQIILLVGLFASLLMDFGKAKEQKRPKALLSLAEIDKITKNATLLRWRGRQLLTRNRASRLSLLMATLFLMLAIACQWIAAPLLLAAVACLFVGIFLGTALCMQIAQDLKCGWLEPFIGISHRMFVGSYYLIGALLGGAFGLVAAGAHFFGGAPLVPGTLLQALQLCAIVMVCPLLIPSIAFQLDARRPVLTVFAGTLITLFIGTAIFVHLASIFILPIVIFYADEYQNNRFYTSYSQH